jgi:hypothetical protein
MSTNISDLPTAGNISLNITEPQGIDEPKSLALDENTISQIVSGIQKASLTGATSLPSRDIPMYDEHLSRDEQTMPNYIPDPSQRDYIMSNDNDDDINKYYKHERTLDTIYDELQTPVLLGVLYFLFQLPFFKKYIYTYFPFLCHSDGNYNLNGLLFTCMLFGFIYYMSMKFVKNFSKF